MHRDDMDALDKFAAEQEEKSGAEVVTKYGIGNVALEERLSNYVLRYEAETVPQLIELIEWHEAKRKREQAERKLKGG